MTFNVLEYARQANIPIVFSSSREVYGDVHRFEGYNEQAADFAYWRARTSASKIAGEAFIYSYARCYGLPYLVFRFSNVYGRYDNDLHRMVRVIPLFIHSMMRGDRSRSTGAGQDARLHVRRRLRRRDRARNRGPRRAPGREPDDQPRLREGNTLVHCAERIAHELGTEPDMTLAPSLLGEVTHYVADLSKARALLDYDPKVPLDDGIARAVAWFREHREAHPEENTFVRGPRARPGARPGLEDAPVSSGRSTRVRRRTGASCARRGAAARPAGPRAGSRRTCPDRDAPRGAGARSSEDGSRCPRR